MDQRGVVVGRATELESVLNGGMASLNSLVREWEIAAGDRVQERLGMDLGLHGFLTINVTSFAAW
jgi:hypothetical protein